MDIFVNSQAPGPSQFSLKSFSVLMTSIGLSWIISLGRKHILKKVNIFEHPLIVKTDFLKKSTILAGGRNKKCKITLKD